MSKTYMVSDNAKSNTSVNAKPKIFSPPKAPRLEKSKAVVEYPHANPNPYADDATMKRDYAIREPTRNSDDDNDKPAAHLSKERPMYSSSVPKVKPRVSEYSRQYPKWEKFPRSEPTLNNREVK